MTRKDKYTQRFDQGLSKLKKTIRSVFNDSAPGSVQEAAKDGGSASKRPESPGPTSDGGKQGIARDDANTNALVDPKISTAPSSKTDGAEQGSARDDANTNAIVDPNIPTAPSSKTMVLVASDLWARAVEELDEKERKKLKPIPQSVQRNGGGDDWLPDVTVIINSTVDILEKKEAEKNTQSNLQNILRTALVAKSLGDAMAKFDTSGYAALGWSIATFGIQIALNAKDSRESILKGAEIVTSFMTRYAEYDKLFGKELPNKEFERLRVRSYAAMLRYIIELKDYLDKGRIEHAGAAVIKPQDRMYEKSKVDLDAADAKVKEYLPIVNQEISQTFQSTMMEFIQRISINSEPYLKSLQSLAFPEMDDRPKDIDKKGTQQGTCEWLLKHDKYTRWNASDVGLLWIKGKAGSGKSTLLRYAYNHAIPAPESNNTTLVLSYFFHGRGTELQKSPLGLFRSLLHQILKAVPDAATEFTSQYQQRCKDYGKPGEQWEWHVQDLTSHFEKILPKVSSQGHPVLIYIDALDECGEENAHHLIEQFQALLKRLAENRETQLRICFGCRDYPIGLVEYGSEIRPEAENALDIENFVTNKLEGAGIRDETMRNQVVKGANGLFMWARLTTDRIIRRRRQGWSIKRIRDEINEQHKDLDGLYRDLVDGMEDKQMSLRLMQWVSFSKRPMKLDAILLPMALDLDDDSPVKSYDYYKRLIPGSMEDKESYIHTLSAGLIEVVHSVGLYNEKKVIVQFIHQSVKDYFEKEGLRKLYPADTAATFDIDVIRDSNFQLARHCLEFFELDGINDKNMADLTFRLPFLNYALGAFREHLRRSDERDGEQKIIYDLFQRHAATLTALATGRTHFKPPKNSLVPLHFIAVEYGLSQTFTAMFQNGIDLNLADNQGATILHIASQYNSYTILKMLLEKTNLDYNKRDNQGSTPLHKALDVRPDPIGDLSEETAALLLDQTNIELDPKNNQGRTPLSFAAEFGRHSIVVKLLGSGRVDADSKDYKGRTPFSYAARFGDKGVVAELLKWGVDAESRNNEGRTPLSYAASEPYNKESIMILLELGKADANSRDNTGRTPLSHAASHTYNKENIMILLELGKADANSRDNAGRTPLSHAASEAFNKEIITILHELGKADANSRDNAGRTPLSNAASNTYNEENIRILLELGKADINSISKGGRTPLSYAAQYGCEDNVKMLLNDGKCDPNSINKDGRTPLAYAAQYRKDGVARRLLDARKCDPNQKDKFGKTPLSRAVENDARRVVELFFETGLITMDTLCHAMKAKSISPKMGKLLAEHLKSMQEKDI